MSLLLKAGATVIIPGFITGGGVNAPALVGVLEPGFILSGGVQIPALVGILQPSSIAGGVVQTPVLIGVVEPSAIAGGVVYEPTLIGQAAQEQGGGAELVEIQPLMWNEIQERRREREVEKLRKRLGLRKLKEREERKFEESLYRRQGQFKVAFEKPKKIPVYGQIMIAGALGFLIAKILK